MNKAKVWGGLRLYITLFSLYKKITEFREISQALALIVLIALFIHLSLPKSMRCPFIWREVYSAIVYI